MKNKIIIVKSLQTDFLKASLTSRTQQTLHYSEPIIIILSYQIWTFLNVCVFYLLLCSNQGLLLLYLIIVLYCIINCTLLRKYFRWSYIFVYQIRTFQAVALNFIFLTLSSEKSIHRQKSKGVPVMFAPQCQIWQCDHLRKLWPQCICHASSSESSRLSNRNITGHQSVIMTHPVQT